MMLNGRLVTEYEQRSILQWDTTFRDTVTYSFSSFSVLASIAEANELLTCCAAIVAILVGVTRIYDWVALKLKCIQT
jgi:hypothetical protein